MMEFLSKIKPIPLHKFTCWLCEEEFYGSAPEVNSCDECHQIGLNVITGNGEMIEMGDDEDWGEFEDMDYEGPIYPDNWKGK